MGELLNSDQTVRDYLLGRIVDEPTLEQIEELLFADEEFCSRVELAEDEIINDYVFGNLSHEEAASFQATLRNDPERRLKVELTQALRQKALARKLDAAHSKPSFLTSLSWFFRQPAYAGAFAMLLIAAIALTIYLGRRHRNDDLAELQSIYQRARPTESRITEFGYAPLTQLRGAPEPGDQNRLRHIENNLIEAAEKTSNAQTHHALGIFYLTQQKDREAITEFESALRFANNDARIHNDLGSAHFELAKAGTKEKRLEELAQSLEQFSKAVELDPNLLEALFNKSLALQELRNPRQARESWNLYLQKDSSSSWADEARKNLARLENEQALFKSDETVLSDFLSAYRSHDSERAEKIHNETKGLLRGATVPLQLCRRYLVARRSGDSAVAKESIDALMFIGNLDQTKNGDSFFFELANFYQNSGAEKTEPLLRAHETFARAHELLSKDTPQAIALFEESRNLFLQQNDEGGAAVAENWAAQMLHDVKKIAECRQRLRAIIEKSEHKKFLVLLPPAYFWLGMTDYDQGRPSESAKNLKTALRLAEAGNDTIEIQHAEDALAKHYAKLGELEPALSYASKNFSDQGLYYQSRNGYWRDKGTLAELALRLKLWSTSLSLSKEALSFVRETSTDDVRLNDSLRHTASAALAREDFAGALEYAGDSLQVALKHGDGADATATKAAIYWLLGDIKRRQKNCGEALGDYDQALGFYRLLPEMTVNSYPIHKGKLFCFQMLNQPEQFAGELKVVMELTEKYRRTIREDSARQAFFDNEQDVFDAAIENAIRKGDSRSAFKFVEDSKARSLLEFVQSPKPIAEVESEFGSVARPLSLPEIQRELPEQVQLVQYAVLPDCLAIWIISKTRFDFRENQINAAELERKVSSYQALIIDHGPPEEIRRAGKELFELLIPADLGPEQQLCFAPDKCLHQLAFATLVSQAGKYLLEDYSLFYAPSASVLVLATANARSKEQIGRERLLSVGNPDFDREENPGLPDLRDAENEAKTIAGLYPNSTELLGTEATKEKFLHAFSGVEVVHFAGHFVPNAQSPVNSKLLFAGGELRSSELSSYKLPKAKLIVMSACETRVERYNSSEGAIGIARTLLALGAPVVVASQWKVDSAPTRDLMVAFHRNRKNGMTSAASLRQAQLEMLRHDETKAPFYWAAFSLFGGYANY